MKQETVFVVDGKVFGKIKEVAAHLGLKHLARRDFARKGIVEVTPEEAEKLVAKQDIEKEVEQKVAQKFEEVKPEKVAAESKKVAAEDEETTNKQAEEVAVESEEVAVESEEVAVESEEVAVESEEKQSSEKETKPKDKKKKSKEPTEEQLKRAKELQEMTGYDTIESLWMDIEEMDESQVVALAKQIKVTWNEDSHSGINRMRACMAIRKAMFPGQKRPKKSKSPYVGLTLAELRELAEEHNLTWRQSDNERIEKMWLVHALKQAGVTPKK